jgi:heterodisulfide reductase subunit C
MNKSNFSIIREIACKVGVSPPESDEEIFCATFLGKIGRAINKIDNELRCAKEKIFALEKLESFTTYKTNPAESVAGIAHRQLGNEDLWVEISRLNSLKFPDVSAHDYYPVGTQLILPKRHMINTNG